MSSAIDPPLAAPAHGALRLRYRALNPIRGRHHGLAGGPPGWSGPMLMKLFVRDADEWIDTMGVRSLLDSTSDAPGSRAPMLNEV